MMYLNGELSRAGWYLLLPRTAPVMPKLPLGLLVAVLLACVTGVWKRGPRMAFLLVPPLVFFALASYSRVNLGVRVVLPVLPFLYIFAAGLAGGACCRMAGRVVLGVCIVWGAISAARATQTRSPTLMKPPAGCAARPGSSPTPTLIGEQGLPQLKSYLDANGIDVVYLSYFGTDRPEAYGIRFQALPTYGRVGEPAGEIIPANTPRRTCLWSA